MSWNWAESMQSTNPSEPNKHKTCLIQYGMSTQPQPNLLMGVWVDPFHSWLYSLWMIRSAFCLSYLLFSMDDSEGVSPCLFVFGSLAQICCVSHWSVIWVRPPVFYFIKDELAFSLFFSLVFINFYRSKGISFLEKKKPKTNIQHNEQ